MKKLTLSALVTLLLVGLTVLVVTVTTRANAIRVGDVSKMVGDDVSVARMVSDDGSRFVGDDIHQFVGDDVSRIG